MSIRLLDRLAGRAVERAFGESVLIQPMKGGKNAAPSADPDRGTATIRAVISIAPEDRGLFAERKAGANTLGSTRVLLAGVWATVTATAVADLGYWPVQGDLLGLIDRPASPRYRITQVDIDDLGAVTLHLAREAAP